MLRRDFLNGALAGAGMYWAGTTAAQTLYPPALTGLRGSHPGSMDLAHERAWSGATDLPSPETQEQYDLVVVGAGISGLATAYYYQRELRKDARILILDNHDDFGGHARRNEFSVQGRRILSYGGTQSLDTPENYSAVAKSLMRQLGVDLVALRRAYDLDYFRRHRLGLGMFYDAKTFGRDVLLPSSLPTLNHPSFYARHYVPGIGVPPAFAQTLAKAPLNPTQRAQLGAVLQGQRRKTRLDLGGDGEDALRYVDVLRQAYGVQDSAVLTLLSMAMGDDSALGASTLSWDAARDGGLLGTEPGRRVRAQAEDLPVNGDDEDLDGYFFHFPDGNATVARLLAQRLVPGLARVASAAQCVDARFDYAQLDSERNPVRIRLGSTAVQVSNQGQGTRVVYARQGRYAAAQAPHTVMAGWSMANAHIVQGLPERQKAAMRANLKLPFVYAQVVLRRWHALQRSGIGVAYAPGAYFQYCQMDFPVSFGGQGPAQRPDEPAVLLMIRLPAPMLDAASPEDQIRAGRAEVLGTDFAHYEAQVLRQLQAMYGAHGFDAQRDVAALTVNRWGHGYTWDEAQFEGEPAHRLSARALGRIHMAGADSTGRAYTDAAIDAAWRAVAEIRSAKG
ncbi:MAG: hypothetical protein A3F78_10760 [Burkholderiales bacterium RIFCSPLOWO2_12_FULL_61_40]|nr:MAG: hypothetical protein A3F78_10760 [Burkholderiales bacterium RIFCSPLOWO2_12_FULL_61_40]